MMDGKGKPTVILAKTIKGYGLGEAGEGRNVTHQQKNSTKPSCAQFRTRFGIPISDEEVSKAPFYIPPADSPEMQYLRERRKELGGYVPARNAEQPLLKIPRGMPSPSRSNRAATARSRRRWRLSACSAACCGTRTLAS